jgi:hypothetical protein
MDSLLSSIRLKEETSAPQTIPNYKKGRNTTKLILQNQYYPNYKTIEMHQKNKVVGQVP